MSTMQDIFSRHPKPFKPLPTLNLSRCLTRWKLLAFIFSLNRKNEVTYTSVKYTSDVQNHFLTLNTDSKYNKKYEKKQWSDIARRLKKPVPDSEKKGENKRNADRRLSLKLDDNFFLVKGFFTTGLRQVEPGYRHVLQIGLNSMYIGTITERTLQNFNLPNSSRIFVDQHERLYEETELCSYKTYIIPSGMYYVIYTYQPSYFSLFTMLNEDRLPKLPFKPIVLPFPKDREPDEEANASSPTTPMASSSSSLHPEDEENFSDLILFHSPGPSSSRASSACSMPPPPSPPPAACSMPPPPPPPVPPADLITYNVNLIPLVRETEVQAVPHRTAWYQKVMRGQSWGPPRSPLQSIPVVSENSEELLDLRTQIRVPEPVPEVPEKNKEQAVQTDPVTYQSPPLPPFVTLFPRVGSTVPTPPATQAIDLVPETAPATQALSTGTSPYAQAMDTSPVPYSEVMDSTPSQAIDSVWTDIQETLFSPPAPPVHDSSHPSTSSAMTVDSEEFEETIEAVQHILPLEELNNGSPEHQSWDPNLFEEWDIVL